MRINAKRCYKPIRGDEYSTWIMVAHITSEMIPLAPGHYEFCNSVGEIVYIGKATGQRGIRNRVWSHINLKKSSIAKAISAHPYSYSVRWRESKIGDWREADLLRSFYKINGRLPLYNLRAEHKPLKDHNRTCLGWLVYKLNKRSPVAKTNNIV